jgi:hypothetical protein
MDSLALALYRVFIPQKRLALRFVNSVVGGAEGRREGGLLSWLSIVSVNLVSS